MNTHKSKQKSTEQALTRPVVGKLISPTELQVNDLFYMSYGFDKVKFRVNGILEDDGLLAHSVNWCKIDSILIPFSESKKIHYAGRMSKLRSWLLL